MKDPFGRQVDYLRISVTDRCNERCRYCMPADFHDWLPREQILSYEEILKITGVGIKHLGMSKFRITGGEPLVRKDVVGFIGELAKFEGVSDIGMTTNALLLSEHAEGLKNAGLKALNISLDALDGELYHEITRGELSKTLDGISAALDAGFERIKLNMVMLKGVNESQLEPMLDFALKHDLLLRFIELMPVSYEQGVSLDDLWMGPELQKRLAGMDELEAVNEELFGHGPARYYRMKKRGQTVGIISAMSDEHFCESCNKLRLTADGFIRPCLGNHGEIDMKPALREVGSEEALLKSMKEAIVQKPDAHTFLQAYTPLRIMTAIGG